MLAHDLAPGLRVLMYHAVSSPNDHNVRDRYNMSYPKFERQMRYLAEQYADCLVPFDHPTTDGDSLRIALTFDDGYRDSLTFAAPLLAELGIPFTVFVRHGRGSGAQCRLSKSGRTA